MVLVLAIPNVNVVQAAIKTKIINIKARQN